MKKNVGLIDRVIRVVAGLAILSLIYFLDGPIRFIGLIGIIPLATGLIGYCHMYTILGISSCSRK
jgi:Protein of unknown function (DUF2892)